MSSENEKWLQGGFTVTKTELERAATEERKAYFKAWRAANKEKTAEHRRRYWEKKAIERHEREAQDGTASGTNEQ